MQTEGLLSITTPRLPCTTELALKAAQRRVMFGPDQSEIVKVDQQSRRSDRLLAAVVNRSNRNTVYGTCRIPGEVMQMVPLGITNFLPSAVVSMSAIAMRISMMSGGYMRRVSLIAFWRYSI